MLTPSAYKRRQTVRKQTQRYVLVLLLLMLLFFGILLTGCGATLPVIEQSGNPCPVIPSAPEPTTPLPSKPYSETVQLKLSEWRALLKATRTTSKP
jgi:hypothetical protein